MKKIYFHFQNLIFIAVLFAGFCRPLPAMDFFEELEEMSHLVRKNHTLHESEAVELVDLSQIIPESIELPSDVWQIILLNLDVVGKVNLSSVNRAFFNFINLLEFCQIEVMSHKLFLTRPKSFKEDSSILEDSPKRRFFFAESITDEVREMVRFAENVRLLREKIQKKKDHPEYERMLIVGASALLEETDKDINVVSNELMQRAMDNPNCLTLCCRLEEEEYLLSRTGFAGGNRIYGCCQLITRNPKLNATITTMLLGAVIIGGIFGFPDPTSPTKIHNFTVGNKFGYCDSGCHEDCLPMGGSWGRYLDYNTSGPAYIYYTQDPGLSCGNGGATYVPGNLSDFIGYVGHQCSCNVSQWYDYAASIINGTLYDPYMAICFPNPDDASICCGQMWTSSVVERTNCIDADVCLNMIKITRKCINTQRGWYYGFMVPLSFMFVWATMIDYFWCAR